ncbi:hypothetical protein B7988_02780 [Fibrobacter sp. UWB1]|nr:hypothetical protein B7988_02780 [Fibrobacter sp. UWB1]
MEPVQQLFHLTTKMKFHLYPVAQAKNQVQAKLPIRSLVPWKKIKAVLLENLMKIALANQAFHGMEPPPRILPVVQELSSALMSS